MGEAVGERRPQPWKMTPVCRHNRQEQGGPPRPAPRPRGAETLSSYQHTASGSQDVDLATSPESRWDPDLMRKQKLGDQSEDIR